MDRTIKIIIDSGCDLPKGFIEKENLELAPLTITLDKTDYLDKVTIEGDELLNKMRSTDDFPKTAQVAPQKFYELYKKNIENGYDLLVISTSSKLSGTHQSACIAKDMILDEGTDANIVVIDSKSVCLGYGLIIMNACTLLNNGADISEIESETLNLIPKIRSSLVFTNIENLVRGGRLSKGKGMLVNALNLKLILNLEDGELKLIDKVRGSKKAITKTFSSLSNECVDTSHPILMAHTNCEDLYSSMKQAIDSIDTEKIEISIGSTVAAHTGDGGVIVFYVES